MAKKSDFAYRREEMYDYLEDNLNATFRLKNAFYLENHAIFALSKQKEVFKLLNFKEETKNPFEIDLDKKNLNELYAKLVKYVILHNESGLIPGFILLQAKTDFVQAKKNKRKDTIVNQLGFNKQILESEKSSKTFFDKRKLTPVEFTLLTLMQQSNQEEIYIPHKGKYEKELATYNPNKHLLEINAYKSRIQVDPILVNSVDSCYNCGRVENFRESHEKCKKTNKYLSAVIERTKERYHRNLLIRKQIGDEDIQVETIELDNSHLRKYSNGRLLKEKYFISSFK